MPLVSYRYCHIQDRRLMSVNVVMYSHAVAQGVMQAHKPPGHPQPPICKCSLVICHVPRWKLLQATKSWTKAAVTNPLLGLRNKAARYTCGVVSRSWLRIQMLIHQGRQNSFSYLKSTLRRKKTMTRAS